MLPWWYSPVQCSQLCAQRRVEPHFSAQSLPHLGQMLWSVTSFSILFILRLFLGMGLSYMPFFRRCSLLWWIWAPCCSWKEHRAFRGLSRTCGNRWRREEWWKIQEMYSFFTATSGWSRTSQKKHLCAMCNMALVISTLKLLDQRNKSRITAQRIYSRTLLPIRNP